MFTSNDSHGHIDVKKKRARLERRHSTPHGEVIGGRRDIDLLNKGATGQVQLGMLAGEFGYNQIKCTLVYKEGCMKTAYIDKTGTIVETKPNPFDDSKIPWIKCEVNPQGELSHFTSMRAPVKVPDAERNCGPIAIYLENASLKGKRTAELQKQIDKNPHKFMKEIEKLSIQSAQLVVDEDSAIMQKKIAKAKELGFFHPGHGVIFMNGEWQKDGNRDAATPKKNQKELKTDYEKITGKQLAANENGSFLLLNNLSGNHRISDKNIQTVVLEDLRKGGQGDLINQLINVFYFKPGHADKQRTLKVLDAYRKSMTTDKKQKNANKIITILSQHTGQISLGNSHRNSSIGEHLDVHAPENSEGKHSLSPRSRETVEKLLRPENKEVLVLIDKPIKKGNKLLSSQYGEGGDQNKHNQDIDLTKLSPRSQRLLTRLNFYEKTSNKRKKKDDEGTKPPKQRKF